MLAEVFAAAFAAAVITVFTAVLAAAFAVSLATVFAVSLATAFAVARIEYHIRCVLSINKYK